MPRSAHRLAMRRSTSQPDASAEHRARRHGPDAVGLYLSGQLLTEDYYVFNKLAQRADRHQQRRHQLAAVHEQRGGRLQADAGRRCAAGLLRRPRHAPRLFIAGSEHGVGAPDPVPPASKTPKRQPPIEVDRRADPRRTETAEMADLHLPNPAGHRRDAVPRHRCTCCCGRTRPIRRTSPRTRSGFDALTRPRCAITRRDEVAQRLRHRAGRPGAGGALVRATCARPPRCRSYCQGLNQSVQRHRARTPR